MPWRRSVPGSSRLGRPRRGWPDEQAARDDARRRLDACRSLQAVRNDLVSAQLDLNAVVSARLRLVEELVTLQQARLDGMAAEIAGRLAVGGGSCPVCGSEHHPHLAAAVAGAPDAAAEKALRKRLDDAEFEEHARAAKARDLETQAALALQAAGSDDLEALHLALAEATRVPRAPRPRRRRRWPTSSGRPRRPSSRPCAWPSSTPPSPSSPAGWPT